MSLDVYLTCDHCETGVFEANVTHNLSPMANLAGLYEACWAPEEIGVTKAVDLVPLLEAGLAQLTADPERFKTINPKNGWGSYDHFVPWVANYLDACRKWPSAKVSVSR